jgi:hypothetical protein
MPVAYQEYIAKFGERSVSAFPLTVGWSRD